MQNYLLVDVDPMPNRKSGKSGVERMLEFGRELFQLSQRLEKEHGANEANQKMLEVISQISLWILGWGFDYLFLIHLPGRIQLTRLLKSVVKSAGLAIMSITSWDHLRRT